MDRRIAVAGAIVALGYFIQTIASYWLAAAQVLIGQTSAEWSFYPSLTGIALPAWLADDAKFLSIYCTPLLIVTIVCIYILFMLYRGSEPSEGGYQSLFRWSLLFAAISIPALPVQTQDFWLSIAFGKETLSGLNPYYDKIPRWMGEAWHPDSFRPRSCYGPLWILVSTAAAALSEQRWVLFGLFKLILGALWLAVLLMIRRITRARTVQERCLALVLFGWLPLSANQILSEGHNDIAFTMLVMLWLYSRNTFALAAAILVKYTAAPLALFTVLDKRKPIELAAAAVVAAGALAVFYRGQGFLTCNKEMLNWHFLTPRDALAFLGQFSAIGIAPFVCAAVFWIHTYFRTGDASARMKAVIATIALVLFGVYPLVWPWYLIILLATTALLPMWQMSIWFTGLALVAPFSALYIFRTNWDGWMAPWPSLSVYALSIVWWGVVWYIRRQKGARDAAPAIT